MLQLALDFRDQLSLGNLLPVAALSACVALRKDCLVLTSSALALDNLTFQFLSKFAHFLILLTPHSKYSVEMSLHCLTY